MHPLPIVLNHGVPVALSSDDPSVFGNMGLTYDFFQVSFLVVSVAGGSCIGPNQVLVASEVTGLSTLGALARDSIEVGCEHPKMNKDLTVSVFEHGVRTEKTSARRLGSRVEGIFGVYSSRGRNRVTVG